MLGTVPYEESLELQRSLVEARRDGGVPDLLLLLEHPHVITVGSGGRSENIVADEAERARLGIGLFETGRGGDVTYHGPGQLVGYPILDLKPDRKDLHKYLRDIEEALIVGLAAVGVGAGRSRGLTGVWTATGKIASIGVRVSSGWITSHGFAVNVTTDLSYFDTIVPCGLEGGRVTSIEHELGRELEPESVRRAIAEAFGPVFGRTIVGLSRRS